MAKPKGKLFALLAIFAAIGLATATGAFTTVQADRTAQVQTTGDSSALLQLNPSSEYAEYASNGQLVINFAGSDGNGVNQAAITDLGQNVFTVTNNGDQTVAVSIEASDSTNGLARGENVVFYVHESELGDNVDVSQSDNPDFQTLAELESNGVINVADDTDASEYVVINGDNPIGITPGDSLDVGVYVDALAVDSQGETLADGVTITADADTEPVGTASTSA